METLISHLIKLAFILMVLGLLLDIIFFTAIGLFVVFIDVILYIQLLLKYKQ